MNSDIVLQVQELKKYFGSVCAVDGVSFSVQRGQVYGFLGPNGSGKTTTIGMILGLLYPTSGTVSLFGEVVTPVKTSPMLLTRSQPYHRQFYQKDPARLLLRSVFLIYHRVHF